MSSLSPVLLPLVQQAKIQRLHAMMAQRLQERSGAEESLLPLLAFFCRELEDGRSSVPLEELCELLRETNSDAPSVKEQAEKLVDCGLDDHPLLQLTRGRLRSGRWRALEERLLRALEERAGALPCPVALREELRSLIPEAGDQRLAAALFLCRRSLLLTGGPGTGKTWTMAACVRLFRRQRQLEGLPEARIHLAAPTGKAAARMAEGFSASEGRPPSGTLHRLLGLGGEDSPPRFHRLNPLPLDLLVVDELSMVSQQQLLTLLEALQPETKLLLLGDPEQLESVESGAVLGALCARPPEVPRELARELSPLLDPEEFPAPGPSSGSGKGLPRVHLRLSRRFPPGSVFDRACSALRAGRAEELLELFDSSCDTGFNLLRREPAGAGMRELRPYLPPFRPLADPDEGELRQALAECQATRILSARRWGPLGVEDLNRRIAGSHAAQGDSTRLREGFAGLPILVRQNAPSLDLYNGDSGLVLRRGERLVAAFLRGGELRELGLGSLPAWDPAWAISIHQSQGSEYERVLAILHDEGGSLLCRELLYTALSRARGDLQLWCTEASLRQALARTHPREVLLEAALTEGIKEA